MMAIDWRALAVGLAIGAAVAMFRHGMVPSMGRVGG